jgi:hypothetical protein
LATEGRGGKQEIDGAQILSEAFSRQLVESVEGEVEFARFLEKAFQR